MFVYGIFNTVNRKLYIGQTVQENVTGRRNNHFGELNRKAHKNEFLQTDWNKFGKDKFTFFVLEYGIKSLLELDSLETKYINELKTTNRKFGYNIEIGGRNSCSSQISRNKISLSRLGKRWPLHSRLCAAKSHRPQGYPVIVSPDGKEYFVVNMTEFCQKKNLDQRRMSSVINGRRITHKGWYVKGVNVEQKKSKIVSIAARKFGDFPKVKSPYGKFFEVDNLTQFCNEHKIDGITEFWRMLRGYKKSHCGWKVI